MQEPTGRGWPAGKGTLAPESVPELPADAYWMLEVGDEKEAYRALKAVALSHRNLERFKLSSRDPTETGQELPPRTTFACEYAYWEAQQPARVREALRRFYSTPGIDDSLEARATYARTVWSTTRLTLDRAISKAFHHILWHITDGRMGNIDPPCLALQCRNA